MVAPQEWEEAFQREEPVCGKEMKAVAGVPTVTHGEVSWCVYTCVCPNSHGGATSSVWTEPCGGEKNTEDT